MSLPQTLLTEEEVILFSKIPKKEIPRNDLEDIFQVEMTERRLTLGKNFYDSLVDDLLDTSSAVKYTAGSSYALGDLVFFEGLLYESLEAANTTEPGTKDKWKFADKFTTQANNDLWCQYLARYLSLHVIDRTIPKQSTSMGGSGTVKYNGDNYQAAKEDSVVRLQTYVKRAIDETFQNMYDYLVANSSNFPLYDADTSDACDDCDQLSPIYQSDCNVEQGGNTALRSPVNGKGRFRNTYNGNVYRLG